MIAAAHPMAGPWANDGRALPVEPAQDWGWLAPVLLGGAAVLGVIGRSVGWLFGRDDKRRSDLESKELAYRERLEARLMHVETQGSEMLSEMRLMRRKLRGVRLLAVEGMIAIERIDPNNAFLVNARPGLKRAFPPEFEIPENLSELARRLNEGMLDDEGEPL